MPSYFSGPLEAVSVSVVGDGAVVLVAGGAVAVAKAVLVAGGGVVAVAKAVFVVGGGAVAVAKGVLVDSVEVGVEGTTVTSPEPLQPANSIKTPNAPTIIINSRGPVMDATMVIYSNAISYDER